MTILKMLRPGFGMFVPGLLVLAACSGDLESPPPASQASPSSQELQAPPPPRVGPSSDFYTLALCRIVDTQKGTPLAAGQAQTFQIVGDPCGIPGSAVTVAANVTAWGTAGRGFIALRADADRGALEIGFDAAGPRSTHILLPLSPDGSITATAQGSGTAHLQIDVSGYFLPTAAPGS